jgi:hypothetical protein
MTSYPGRPGTRTACSALPNAGSPAGAPATYCSGGRRPASGELVRPSSGHELASPGVTVSPPGLPLDRARACFGEHLIRRSGHIVQDRLSWSVRWADIPQLSARDAPCPSAWLQSWRPRAEPRPSAFQAGHIPSWRESCECYALSVVAAVAVTVAVSSAQAGRCGDVRRYRPRLGLLPTRRPGQP